MMGHCVEDGVNERVNEYVHYTNENNNDQVMLGKGRLSKIQ